MQNTYVWVFAGIGLVALTAVYVKSRLTPQLEPIDSAPLDKIKVEIVESLYNLAVEEVPSLIGSGKMKSNAAKLTMYSLYKQINEGNAPSQMPSGVQKVKFEAWKNQRGKSELRCKKEYILLIAEYSSQVNATLVGVLNGTIKELNYKVKDKIAESTGGALAKSVPKPKDMYTEQNK